MRFHIQRFVLITSVVFFACATVLGQQSPPGRRLTASQTRPTTNMRHVVHEVPTASTSVGSHKGLGDAQVHFASSADFRQLARRLTLATVFVLSGCFLAILAARRVFGDQTQGPADSSLQTLCTLRVSSRAFVSLIKAGGQTLVVGHDSTGLRSMVMLHGDFQDSLREHIGNLPSTALKPSDTLSKLRSLVNSDQARGAYGQHNA